MHTCDKHMSNKSGLIKLSQIKVFWRFSPESGVREKYAKTLKFVSSPETSGVVADLGIKDPSAARVD